MLTARRQPLIDELIDSEAPELLKKLIDVARESDAPTLRWLIDRRWPRPVGRLTNFVLPEGDLAAQLAAIRRGIAEGELTISEASQISQMVEQQFQALDMARLDERVTAIETRLMWHSGTARVS